MAAINYHDDPCGIIILRFVSYSLSLIVEIVALGLLLLRIAAPDAYYSTLRLAIRISEVWRTSASPSTNLQPNLKDRGGSLFDPGFNTSIRKQQWQRYRPDLTVFRRPHHYNEPPCPCPRGRRSLREDNKEHNGEGLEPGGSADWMVFRTSFKLEVGHTMTQRETWRSS